MLLPDNRTFLNTLGNILKKVNSMNEKKIAALGKVSDEEEKQGLTDKEIV